MPGKVQPVMPEMATQAAIQVTANDVAVSAAAAAGQLELNAFLPLIAHNLLQSMDLTAKAARLLADRCVAGIKADAPRCKELLDRSHCLIPAFSPDLGYEKSTEVVRTASREGKSVPAVILEQGLMTASEVEAVLRPEELTTPGVAGARLIRQLRSGGRGNAARRMGGGI